MTFHDEMMSILSINDNCQCVNDKIKILMSFRDVDDKNQPFLMIYVKTDDGCKCNENFIEISHEKRQMSMNNQWKNKDKHQKLMNFCEKSNDICQKLKKSVKNLMTNIEKSNDNSKTWCHSSLDAFI